MSSMLKGWKPVSNKSLSPKAIKKAPMPEDNIVESVKTAETQSTKFNSEKRKLAHFKNLFKNSKD